MKSVLLTLALMGMISLSPVMVQAQAESAEAETSESAPDATGTTGTIFQKQRLNEQIEDVIASYRQKLEEYRTADREYSLAVAQYRKLNTLASLEEAVLASKEAMKSRSEVLTTYLTLLRLQLVDANGISLAQKQRALQSIDDILISLAEHRTQIDSISDRYKVEEVANTFLPLSAQIENTSYYSMSLLEIGQLQAVFDKIKALAADMERQNKQETSALKKAERERAYTEINNKIDEVVNTFKVIVFELDEKKESNIRGRYTNTVKKLGLVYAGQSQILEYLYEVNEL